MPKALAEVTRATAGIAGVLMFVGGWAMFFYQFVKIAFSSALVSELSFTGFLSYVGWAVLYAIVAVIGMTLVELLIPEWLATRIERTLVGFFHRVKSVGQTVKRVTAPTLRRIGAVLKVIGRWLDRAINMLLFANGIFLAAMGALMSILLIFDLTSSGSQDTSLASELLLFALSVALVFYGIYLARHRKDAYPYRIRKSE